MKFDTTGLEAYITDGDREAVDGVWLKFGPEIRIRVLRAGGANQAYTRAAQAAVRPHRRQIDRGTMSQEYVSEIMREVYAKHVVKGWEGVNDSEGNPVPYTVQNCIDFFEAVPELFDELIELASSLNTFSEARAAEAEEVLGNS